MIEPSDEDELPSEFGPVLPLPPSELMDGRLFALAVHVAQIERDLEPSDYARVPSLHEMIEATRKVAIELGYGDEPSGGAE